MKFAHIVVPAVLAGFTAVAAAAPIVGWTTADATTYGHVVNFDSQALAVNATVSTQFQAEGLVFSGTVRANSCGGNAWTAYGMTNNNLNTYGPGCVTNGVNDAFSLKFSSAVSAVAMDAYLYDSRRADTFDLYNNGVLVASYDLTGVDYEGLSAYNGGWAGTRYFYNSPSDRAGILRLSANGALFDELRFTENQASGSATYFVFDNVRFTTAAVPEPASLALFGLGMAGLAALRRKQASK